MAYEVVNSLPRADALVVYCQGGDNARRVATALANEATTSALLVADECDVEVRAQIESLLTGHRQRVRVISIDNTGQRFGIEPELLLGKMNRETLIAVLDANYAHVSPDRRRAYADLANGFPLLAAKLCDDDERIGRAGHVGPGVPAIHEYLRLCLNEEQWEALSALALVTKIGYTGDVQSELDSLCGMLSLARSPVERALHRIHDHQGFVARTGRYFYVTPELVAQVAYQEAWQRWGQDPNAFWKMVPDDMIQTDLDRAWRSAPQEVRRSCAAFFRDWVQGLKSRDLSDITSVRRLVSLTDTHPIE